MSILFHLTTHLLPYSSTTVPCLPLPAEAPVCQSCNNTPSGSVSGSSHSWPAYPLPLLPLLTEVWALQSSLPWTCLSSTLLGDLTHTGPISSASGLIPDITLLFLSNFRILWKTSLGLKSLHVVLPPCHSSDFWAVPYLVGFYWPALCRCRPHMCLKAPPCCGLHGPPISLHRHQFFIARLLWALKNSSHPSVRFYILPVKFSKHKTTSNLYQDKILQPMYLPLFPAKGNYFFEKETLKNYKICLYLLHRHYLIFKEYLNIIKEY